MASPAVCCRGAVTPGSAGWQVGSVPLVTDLMPQLVALLQVLVIDLVLAGDNAIVVGLAVNGLPAEQRQRAIFLGVAAATVLRIAFAFVTLELLAIVGLLFAGGLLL